jgi:ABC-2 type transport system permease protein
VRGFSFRRVWTILRKDLVDAIRDARVLIALLVPLGIGLFYSFIFDDTEPAPTATVVYSEGAGAEFIATLSSIVASVVDVDFKGMSDDDVRQQVAQTDADLGLLLPADFDAAVLAGSSPPLTALIPEDRTFGGDYVLAAIDPALRQMAGQQLPATFDVETQVKDLDALSLFDRIGIRTYLVLVSLIMTITMIGIMAVPIVLAEESEKKTIDALALISSYEEIVTAKAALGLIYLGISATILTVLTRLQPHNWPLYVAAILLMALTVIGFGLLFAGLMPNASQLNNWSSLVILPFIAPAFLVETGISDLVERIAGLLPTGAGMRLLIDSATNVGELDTPLFDLAIIAFWAVVAYALLLLQLRRRRS